MYSCDVHDSLFREWIAIGDRVSYPEALIGGVYAIESSWKSALCRETGTVVYSLLDMQKKDAFNPN